MSRSLRERLEDWSNFEECLVHDVRPIMFGFGVDLVMNYIWSDSGVREKVLESPRLVTLRMLGVDHISFVGDLTESMKENPKLINWGLTEVARIVPVSASSGLGIAVEWEGRRRLEVGFSELDIIASET
ncbi:hypothetical protein [Actinoplanes aureus]|uniref:Uncharacterized protein n=1 Tax=Actinoplanes aureus TaxID=2792083 RepID=A0A931CLC3_9ACTN|nr:hypothetical protein [Actinoplanes aureus]MBG0568526.1 hypothetical protein [Actinoplanes aureus]